MITFSFFKGFKTFINSPGERFWPKSLLRSAANVECGKIPRAFFAGGGTWNLLAIGVSVTLVIFYLIVKQRSNGKESIPSQSESTDKIENNHLISY